MGAGLSAGYYRFVKYMNNGDLEGANEGQDDAGGDFVQE